MGSPPTGPDSRESTSSFTAENGRKRLPAFTRYLIGALAGAATVWVRWALIPLIGTTAPYHMLYPTVMIVAVGLGTGPGLLTAIVGLWMTERWLVEPIGAAMLTWAVLFRWLVMILGAVFVGYVGDQLRRARRRARTEAESCRNSELSLRASEERLRQAVRVSGLGIFDHDIRTDVLQWSPQLRQMYAFGPDEPVSVSVVLDSVHPEDRARIAAAMERTHDPAGDGSYAVEHRIIRRDGSIRWLTRRAQTFFEGKGAERHPVRTVGAVLDVTDRVRAEEALYQNRLILAQAGQLAHLGAWDIEFVNLEDVNANPLHWSEEVYRIFGYEPGGVEVSSKLFHSRVHPDDRQRVADAIAQAIAEKRTYTVEHRILRPDGSERSVVEHAQINFDGQGRPLRMVGAVQDVTERKQAEAERVWLASFPELAPFPIAEVDKQGSPTYLNGVAKELFPDLPRKGREHPWLTDLETVREAFQAGNAPVLVRQVAVGERYYLQTLYWATDGPRIRIYGLDITERVRAEEALEREAQELERSNHDLAQFAAVISHDVQQPMVTVALYLNLLKRALGQNLTADASRSIEVMDRVLRDMQSMVQGMLAYAQVESQAKPVLPVDTDAVLERTLLVLQGEIERNGARVTHELLPQVLADDMQLGQVFQNLLTNALKFHPPNRSPEIHIGSRDEGEGRLIWISDNGIGFDSKDKERIFGMFQRLHKEEGYPGSGIGLATVKKIIQRHGGRIWVESEPGKGATFFITLPKPKAAPPR